MLFLRIKTFIKSLWFHIAAGLPKCTQEEIYHRLKICLACEKFDTINSQCKTCGCNISSKKQFLNKLAWKDQECPLEKWNKI